MKIAIVNTLAVPSGNASVNRFLGYGKELVRLGADVSILTSARCEDCEIDGIKVVSCGKGTSMFGALKSITKTIRKGGYDSAILISNSLLLIYPLWFACKRGKVKLIQEKSEFPFVLMKRGFLNRLYAKFYVNTTYKLFDGLIVMTKPLMEYFKDKVRKDCQLFEMPMTVDIERFLNAESTPNTLGDYIAFCGGLSNTNGIDNLIESFSLVEPQIPTLKLVIIGGAPNEIVMNGYQELVSGLGLKNVVFYGKVGREEIPGLLNNAKALLLARRSNLQASGGFPTKLGEYLATGNPVVVTAVGDIPLYLNTANSFIVKPDDNKAFAQQILEVFADYDRAETIGKEGQKLAITVFNARVQSERLNSFLHSLI